MDRGHIVKSFDDEIDALRSRIVEMGGFAEAQLAAALNAMARRDPDLAARVVAEDAKVDAIEREVDETAVELLALRQPMADDLREVLSALKISGVLERIADYAANVAKRVGALSQVPPVAPGRSIPRMGRLVGQMIKDVLDAYIQRDADKAVAVWHRDAEVDQFYDSLFRELLTYMMEDPRNITPCTHLLFVAKNIERMGDHTTNIAEMIHFLVHGRPLTEERPKADTTASAVLEPPGSRAGDEAEG